MQKISPWQPGSPVPHVGQPNISPLSMRPLQIKNAADEEIELSPSHVFALVAYVFTILLVLLP